MVLYVCLYTLYVSASGRSVTYSSFTEGQRPLLLLPRHDAQYSIATWSYYQLGNGCMHSRDAVSMGRSRGIRGVHVCRQLSYPCDVMAKAA